MKFVAGLVGVSTLLLAGCAANSYCLDKQEYQDAEDLAPLQPVDGLKMPTSPTALKIPPKTNRPAVPFGVADAKGNGLCLDKPPAMPQPPAAAKPVAAPVAKPAEAPAAAAKTPAAEVEE